MSPNISDRCNKWYFGTQHDAFLRPARVDKVDMEGEGEWWYAGEIGEAHGPVCTAKIVELFLDGVVDGLTSITQNVNLPKDQWTALGDVVAIRNEISAAGRADDAEVDGTGKATTDAVEDRGNVAKKNSEANGSVEEEKPTPSTPAPEPEAPNTDVAALQESKRLSRKRRRAANRLKKRAATSVYVTGLPSDATFDEVAEYFAKCGIILPSSENGRPRVKLYADESGELKGDAMITYALAPSVENAIELLDGVPLRYGGNPLSVERASFEHKDEAEHTSAVTKAMDGAKRPRGNGNGSAAIVQDALSWAEDGQAGPSRAPRIVVLKNVFVVANAEYDIVQEDMEEGCAGFGEVEKITVFEGNPEGVVAIQFATSAAAKKCIQVMDNRWYDKRRLSAAFFDGVTDFRAKKDDGKEAEQRDAEWSKWLDGDDAEGQGSAAKE